LSFHEKIQASSWVRIFMKLLEGKPVRKEVEGNSDGENVAVISRSLCTTDNLVNCGNEPVNKRRKVLQGRIPPKEKEDEHFPTAIELQKTALTPAAQTDFQCAEIVDSCRLPPSNGD